MVRKHSLVCSSEQTDRAWQWDDMLHTYATGFTRVRGKAGIQQLRGDVGQGHAAVQVCIHKLHDVLVAHDVPNSITSQHKESVLGPQLHLAAYNSMLSTPVLFKTATADLAVYVHLATPSTLSTSRSFGLYLHDVRLGSDDLLSGR